MRPIKFRALKDDMSDFRFVYGNLIYDHKDNPRIQEDRNEPTFTTCIKGTERQFTGLHDKNGKEIFEGDKLRDDYSDEETVIEDYAVVVWDGKLCQWAIDNSFAKDGSSFTNMVEYFGRENLEVIGNIHENPELLKAVSSKK